MKDTHFLYSVAVFAVLVITSVFIAYATDTLPRHTPRELSTFITQRIPEKKDCDCCSEKLQEPLEKIKAQILENEDINNVWVELLEQQ